MGMSKHLEGLTDAQLVDALETAKGDLEDAATQQPNSEWHEACLAAVMAYALEINKRGIQLAYLH